MLVSIIIATYNRNALLLETVKSILNQTYPDFELIIVSDGLLGIEEALKEKIADSRLRYYEIEHHGRPAVPRNFGINKARGKYIAFCDDDDIWLPDKLMTQTEYLNQYTDVGLVFCAFKIQSSGKEHNNKIIGPKTKILSQYCYDRLLRYNFITSSSVMVRSSVLNDIGVFDEDPNMAAVEDWDLWLRICASYKIAFIPEVLGIYRMNNYSFSSDGRRLQKAEYVINKHLQKGWIGQNQANRARVNIYIREGWFLIDKNVKLSRSLFYNALRIAKFNPIIYIVCFIGLFLSICPFLYAFVKKRSLDQRLSRKVINFQHL